MCSPSSTWIRGWWSSHKKLELVQHTWPSENAIVLVGRSITSTAQFSAHIYLTCESCGSLGDTGQGGGGGGAAERTDLQCLKTSRVSPSSSGTSLIGRTPEKLYILPTVYTEHCATLTWQRLQYLSCGRSSMPSRCLGTDVRLIDDQKEVSFSVSTCEAIGELLENVYSRT